MAIDLSDMVQVSYQNNYSWVYIRSGEISPKYVQNRGRENSGILFEWGFYRDTKHSDDASRAGFGDRYIQSGGIQSAKKFREIGTYQAAERKNYVEGGGLRHLAQDSPYPVNRSERRLMR